MEVYKAIAAVMADIGKIGISKDRTSQSFKFRGIDDVLNALNPILVLHSLVVLPRVISRESVERATKNGGALFYVTLLVEFDFVSAVDGSKHTVATYGEAMDSSDKATNKAMSAAYKYACFQAFCIPTEGDNDADAHTHEVAINPATATAAELAALRGELIGAGKTEVACCTHFRVATLDKVPRDDVIATTLKLVKDRSKTA